MRLRSIGAVLLGLMLTGISSAWAQVSTTGAITVVVEDPQGGRLPGVAVSAQAVDTVTSRTVVTDGEGVATLEAMAPSSRYVVKAQLSGFKELEQGDILVRSGQVTSLRFELQLGAQTEVVEVTGTSTPLVDVTRAVSGADITLRLTESLPTGRSYQSYLQLVPGVMPDTAASGGNPASRSGVNWKDASTTSDNVGSSADNIYYLEGINVTDPVTGTFGANMNTEIIQEQKVITGGIPAEYVGAAGLISTVITKSGSNQYTGSANYFFRNDGFVAQNIHSTGSPKFNTKDTAFTLGGPVVKNNLWVFGSFRYLNTGRDVFSTQAGGAFLRKSETIEKQTFAKGTYALTKSDVISFLFSNDPFKRTSDTDGGIVNNRTRRREQGGNNYSVTYNRVWNSFLIDAAYNDHDAQISDYAADETSRNTVSFQTSDARTLLDEQLGGFGQNAPETRPSRQFRFGIQKAFGGHKLKAGYTWAKYEDRRSTEFTGPDRAQYTSISNRYLAQGGVTAGSIATGPWSAKQFVSSTASDFNGLIAAFNASPNRAALYNQFDADRNGTISAAEVNAALVFNSTAGNPNGQINYYRNYMSELGPRNTQTKGSTFFIQDEFQLNRLSFNAGFRAEQLGFYATTGDNVFQFDWVYAPRFSAVYDIKGDGTQKLSGYWGRYYAPLRVDMANFTGTATGAVTQEQVFVNGSWLTYRTRGGAATIDGFFSPSTKTPYTDELQFQYEADLGHNTSVSATYYNRKTRDIFEDFDPVLYTEPAAYGDTTAPNSLFLGWPYFGWTAQNHPAANFFLGTLPGGERNYNGIELVARRRFADSWQALASYSFLDAKGNAISVGNADFAGDVIWLDPRAPNMYGTVPGTIKNLFKFGGSYSTKFGLELGANYSWNSGTIVNKTQSLSNRRLPIQGTAYTYGGITDNWVDPSAVGAVQNPSWGKLDLRIQYNRRLVGRITGEAFLDIFNVTNNQSAIRLQDLAAGSGSIKYLDEFVWQAPRNAFVGFRVRF